MPTRTSPPCLPQRMALCVAGNGGQLVKALTDEQLTRLCSLAMTRLAPDHPLRALLPVQSRHPKQEVARGLLARDDALQSAVHGADRWNGTRPYGGPEREDLLSGYLPLFYRVFPQAAERLMPRAFEEADGVRLTPTARKWSWTPSSQTKSHAPRRMTWPWLCAA